VTLQFDFVLTKYPPSFNSAVFESRSEERATLVRSEWASAKTLLNEDGSYSEAFFQQSFETQKLA